MTRDDAAEGSDPAAMALGVEQADPVVPESAARPEARTGFHPVLEFLEHVSRDGAKVTGLEVTANAWQSETLVAQVATRAHESLQLGLLGVAAEGFMLLLRPTGADQYELVAVRAEAGKDRGLAFIGVDKLQVVGDLNGQEAPETLKALLEYEGGILLPMQAADALSMAGYRSTIRSIADGELAVVVSPGEAIRRVRVRGHTPLRERDIRRVLSVSARPGALAPTPCVNRKKLHRKLPMPIFCAPGDTRCHSWEETERTRIERFLFDEGYVAGTASFAVVCNADNRNPRKRTSRRQTVAASDERSGVTLEVRLQKRKPLLVKKRTLADRIEAARAKVSGPRKRGLVAPTKYPRITGNLAAADQRWVQRMFKPTRFLLARARITRKAMETARERVQREYASPRGGISRGRRALSLAYPGIRIESNYDRLRREDGRALVDSSKSGRRSVEYRLDVDVQLGKGVDSGFLGDRRVSENRLRSQLQIFERREAATSATAAREAANLRAYYQSRGFMLAQVTGKFQDFGGLHKLTFEIKEGPRVRIREASLQRPAGVSDVVLDEIEREVGRARKLKSGGRFTDVGARKDLGLVLAAYAKRGYVCARGVVRVAFWKSGLSDSDANATLDLTSELEDTGTATWLGGPDAGLKGSGLEAIGARKRAGVWVRIEIDPGPRALTSSDEIVHHLEVQIPASREVDALPRTDEGWATQKIFEDGPLRRAGDPKAGRVPLSLTKDREVERDVVRRYQEAGYPLADAELRWLYTDSRGVQHRVASADRLTEESVGFCADTRRETDVTIATELSVYEGRPAKFGTTLVRGNFKTRYRRKNGKPAALAREIEWKEGDPWSKSAVDRTRAGIDGMGVTENVAIRPQPRNCTLDSDPNRDCVVHQVVSITESKDRAMDIEWGFGAATLDPLYGFVRPSFPNMWGTAWDLAFDAHVGANIPALRDAFCIGEDCYERSGRVSLTRRRIGGSPLTFDITGQVQRRATPARGQIDSALVEVRLTWPITKQWSVFTSYLVQVANISKDLAKPTLGTDTGCGASGMSSCRPPNRGEAIVPDRTAALRTGARWERVDNAFNPDKGVILSAEAMLASPCLGGQDWWAKLDFGWEHFVPLGPNQRWNFRYALAYGHEVPIPLPRRCAGGDSRTSSVPEVWRYFGGGTRDLGVRGILPQTMLLDIETIRGPFGTTTLRPTAQGGHIRALGTLAIQVVSVRNFVGGRLAHSLFFDFGVLTQHWRQVVWARDLRRSVGVNFIKWDIGIVTVSLGYAVLIPNRIAPGNVRPVDDQNGRFVFDVGATF